MVLEFVDGLKSKLADMDEKLDALGSAVGAMHEDVKRLAGRPFLEVYEEWRKRKLESVGSKLPSAGVYVSKLPLGCNMPLNASALTNMPRYTTSLHRGRGMWTWSKGEVRTR